MVATSTKGQLPSAHMLHLTCQLGTGCSPCPSNRTIRVGQRVEIDGLYKLLDEHQGRTGPARRCRRARAHINWFLGIVYKH
jgi:hypothetical protein